MKVLGIALLILQMISLSAMQTHVMVQQVVGSAASDTEIREQLLQAYFNADSNHGIAVVVCLLENLHLNNIREARILTRLEEALTVDVVDEIIRRRNGVQAVPVDDRHVPPQAGQGPRHNSDQDELLRQILDEIRNGRLANRQDFERLAARLAEMERRNNENNDELRRLLEENNRRFDAFHRAFQGERMRAPQQAAQIDRIEALLRALLDENIRPTVRPTVAAQITGALLDGFLNMLRNPIDTGIKVARMIEDIKRVYDLFWPKPQVDNPPKEREKPKDKPVKDKKLDDWCSYKNKPIRRERRHLQSMAKRGNLSPQQRARLKELDDLKRATFRRK